MGRKLYLRENSKGTVHPYASPVNKTDFSGLPPCYTFVGDGEPFYAETLQFVDQLKKAGIEAEVDIYHTDVHAFDMLRPEEDLSKKEIAAFERIFEFALPVCSGDMLFNVFNEYLGFLQ